MKTTLSAQQQVQEDEYLFPYHYLSLYSELHRDILHAHYLSELKLLRELLGVDAASRLIDIGCGDGRFAYELGESAAEYLGVDYSARAIALARAFNPSRRFECGDLTGCVSTGKFSHGIAIQVLEHIPIESLASAVRNIADAIEPGGKFVASVPSTNLPLARKHYQHFTVQSLQKALSPAFELVSAHGHIMAGSQWRRFCRMQKIASILWPMHKSVRPSAWYIRRVVRYFQSIRVSDPAHCHTLVGVFRRL